MENSVVSSSRHISFSLSLNIPYPLGSPSNLNCPEHMDKWAVSIISISKCSQSSFCCLIWEASIVPIINPSHHSSRYKPRSKHHWVQVLLCLCILVDCMSKILIVSLSASINTSCCVVSDGAVRTYCNQAESSFISLVSLLLFERVDS